MDNNRESDEIVMNKKCQVFTPNGYVKKLLDSVGYNDNLSKEYIGEFMWRWKYPGGNCREIY